MTTTRRDLLQYFRKKAAGDAKAPGRFSSFWPQVTVRIFGIKDGFLDDYAVRSRTHDPDIFDSFALKSLQFSMYGKALPV
jgi:hypothetical protein